MKLSDRRRRRVTDICRHDEDDQLIMVHRHRWDGVENQLSRYNVRVTSPVGCSDCRRWWRQWRVSIKLRALSVICGSARRHGSADERCRPAGVMEHRRRGWSRACGMWTVWSRSRSSGHCGQPSLRPLNWEVIPAAVLWSRITDVSSMMFQTFTAAQLLNYLELTGGRWQNWTKKIQVKTDPH